MNNSSPIQYGARQEELRSSIPALQRVIAACNFVTATRLAISGYEYSARGYYFVPWMKSWLFFQCLLPSPDIFLRLFWPRDFSPAAIHRSGFFICAIAVLMAALGIALLFTRRWVLLAELVVCLLAIAGRFFALAELMKPANARPPHDLYSWLYFLGLIPALVFASYSWRRFRQPLPVSSKRTAGEQAAQTNRQEMPTSTFFLSLLAAFFYGSAIGTVAAHMDYWPKRYMLMHTVLVGGAYLAVMVLASVPRLRRYAGPVGIGVAIASFFALGLRGTLDPSMGLINLGFALGALINGEPAAMFLGGFILSNILLAAAAARYVKWSRPETIFILLGAAICAAAIGPLTNGIESHEEALANTVRGQAGLVPARMYTVQKCLLQYAHTNPRGSYPGSLRELNADIPGCMDPAVASGETVDGFQYKFDSSEDHAGIHRFHLLADSIHSTGKSHVAFFSDESFVLRKTDDINYAAEKGRAYVPTTKFTLFLGSIQNHTHLERERVYWEKNRASLPLETLGSSDLHYPETLVDSRAPGYFPTSGKPRDANSFADDSHVYSYEKTAGPPENFRLEMRPARYGATGVLSFFVDNTGIVRATPEDRPATPQDPPAYACAYDVYSPDCVVPVMTGPVDLDTPFPKGRQQPPEEAFHPGGLAKDATPKLFWRINNGMPKFLGISKDAKLLYVTNVLTGISALRTSDGSVAWTLPRGANGVAGGDALYTLSSDGLLMRIESTGRVVWRFSAVGAKELVRARNGTLFVPGGYLWAVNENGGQVWRMQLAEFGAGFPALSPDEKTLYVASIARLYAIDTSRGALRWSVANPCLSLARQCAPRVLSNGSVAYESIGEHRVKSGSNTFDYQIRVLGADGKEIWSRPADYSTEFVVPPGTSILAVRDSHGLEILDEHGISRAVRKGVWTSLNVTQRPGLFFACGLAQRYYYFSGFDADGREVLHMDWTELGSTDCGPVHNGPGNLLFYDGVESVHGQDGLWSFLFPGGTT